MHRAYQKEEAQDLQGWRALLKALLEDVASATEPMLRSMSLDYLKSIHRGDTWGRDIGLRPIVLHSQSFRL
jgi:hypothetical protein